MTWARRTGYQDRRVNEIIADGIWTTVQLGLMAFALSVVVGIPLGIFAALGHNRGPDYARHQHLHHRHRHAQSSSWRSC